MKILQSHKFEEGGEADDDPDDTDLPLGMTILTDETYSTLQNIHFLLILKHPKTADISHRYQSQTADISKPKPYDQSFVPTLESAPSTKTIQSSTDPVHSVVTHAATATATHSVKQKARKPRSRSRAVAGLDVPFVREKVYIKDQLRKLKRAESEYHCIEFSAYYSMMTIGKKGGVIRGEGIQLRVPPNAIDRQQSRTISLRACIDGPFQLPEYVHLTSPIFLVTCTPHCDFQREVALTLHHFVQLISCKECDMMVLLTSPQTPTRDKHGSHWRFEISDKQPHCFQNITFGEVELTHFSFVCFGMQISRVHPLPESSAPNYHYQAFVYSPVFFSPPCCIVLFSVCLCHEVYRMRLQNAVDSFDEYNLKKMNDVPCSIEKEVKVIPPANAEGYTTTSNQAPVILKEIVDKIRLRWWERRRRGDSVPPWILFRVSQTNPTRTRGVYQLHFKVEGINNRTFDGFNLATHSTAQLQNQSLHVQCLICLT